MTFLKKIEDMLEEIEQKKIRISGTALGLFFIGFVLLVGLHFTSEDFRHFSTLVIKPGLICNELGGQGRCIKYGVGVFGGISGDGGTSSSSSFYVKKPVVLNWPLALFVGSGVIWVFIRKGWMRKLVRGVVLTVRAGWQQFSAPYDE